VGGKKKKKKKTADARPDPKHLKPRGVVAVARLLARALRVVDAARRQRR
jgi:hypothetical protein